MVDNVTSDISGINGRAVLDGSAKGLDCDASPACPDRHGASRTRQFVRTLARVLQVVIVSCFLGGCALVDDFVFSDFGVLRGLGKDIGSIVEAGTATVRPLDQFGKGMDQVR